MYVRAWKLLAERVFTCCFFGHCVWGGPRHRSLLVYVDGQTRSANTKSCFVFSQITKNISFSSVAFETFCVCVCVLLESTTAIKELREAWVGGSEMGILLLVNRPIRDISLKMIFEKELFLT